MADKYVKLDDALRVCTEHEDWYRETNDQFGTIVADDIFQSIINLPTADVEEVKDCEKCEHFDKHSTQPICISCSNRYPNNFKPKMDGGKAE